MSGLGEIDESPSFLLCYFFLQGGPWELRGLRQADG